MRTQPPIVAPVFRSDGQARVLAELLLDDRELSVTDIAERIGVAYATVHKEVNRLIEAGILRERRAGRTRMIAGDPTSPLVRPLREILLVTSGPAVLLSEVLATIDGVHRAFLFGSFAARARGVAGPAPSDIDVMVIGQPRAGEVYDACRRVEGLVGRPVNPTILTEAEFAEDSGFLQSVRSNPIVSLIEAA